MPATLQEVSYIVTAFGRTPRIQMIENLDWKLVAVLRSSVSSKDYRDNMIPGANTDSTTHQDQISYMIEPSCLQLISNDTPEEMFDQQLEKSLPYHPHASKDVARLWNKFTPTRLHKHGCGSAANLATVLKGYDTPKTRFSNISQTPTPTMLPKVMTLTLMRLPTRRPHDIEISGDSLEKTPWIRLAPRHLQASEGRSYPVLSKNAMSLFRQGISTYQPRDPDTPYEEFSIKLYLSALKFIGWDL
ncbi:MAG: hypothetical protein J3Q66DRAFT_405041 [Benniella sp.]|nr:MAG: hypothetical protein J3Q66DRAFT_405041 [Benniella sp.]